MFWFLKDQKFVKETTKSQSIARIEKKNYNNLKKVKSFQIFYI